MRPLLLKEGRPGPEEVEEVREDVACISALPGEGVQASRVIGLVPQMQEIGQGTAGVARLDGLPGEDLYAPAIPCLFPRVKSTRVVGLPASAA